jgi:phage tail-like protein
VDLRHVRVQFNAGVDASALQSYPYTFIAQAVPSYNPTVLSARFINGTGIVENSLVELYLENCLSPGLTYELSIAGVIGVPATTAMFVAFAPNWPATRRMDLWDVVPDINKAEDTSEHLERFILCLQDQLDTTLTQVDNWTNILDIDRAPEDFLDLMLEDLGNPFRFEDLTENDKRLLLRVLVQIYQLKGTDPGIQAALRLLMRFESQINVFRQSGALLGKVGTPLAQLDDTFVLGGGGPYDFTVTVATTNPAGRVLTGQEVSRIEQIVDYMKPVTSRFVRPIFYGIVSSERTSIAVAGSDVTIKWRQASVVPTYWRVYSRTGAPGVSPFNSARYEQVDGTDTMVTLTVPFGSDPSGTTYYFNVIPFYNGTEGFRGAVEVRNNLPAPAGLSAAGGVRSVTVSWNAVGEATSYKVYKTLSTTAAASTPPEADFAFEVLGGETTFRDVNLLPGQQAHYCVVARIGDAEGYHSISVSGTAT